MLTERIIPVCFVALSLAGCTSASAGGGENQPDDPSGLSTDPDDWREALEAAGESAYSLAFAAIDPEGGGIPALDDYQSFLRAMWVPGISGSACDIYSTHIEAMEKERTDFWVLMLEASGGDAGEYPIVVHTSYPSNAPFAHARLERWSNGNYVQRRTALGGVVTIQRAATGLDTWSGDLPLEAVAELEFPVENVTTIGCGSGANADGSDATSACHCFAESGEPFTCEPTKEIPDCCHAFEAERVKVTISLAAEPCAEMCVATSLVHDRLCREL